MEHLPAWTLVVVALASMRNRKVGWTLMPSMRALQISSTPLAVFVTVSVETPEPIRTVPTPCESTKAPGFRSETVISEPVRKPPTMRHWVLVAPVIGSEPVPPLLARQSNGYVLPARDALD